MQINLKNAIRKFYPNPVLEQVYFEAIANSIYANATEIDLIINIESYSKPDTFELIIKDNGDGFNDRNFEKFCKLLETDNEEHKGLGRLVFLNYFKDVKVVSKYNDEIRTFIYSQSFDENKFENKNNINKENQTVLHFKNYSKKTVYKYDFIKPSHLKFIIELHFFPLFHQLKKDYKNLCINISLNTKEKNSSKGFYNDKQTIIVKEIPDLELIKLPSSISIFDEMELFYSIEKNNEPTRIITAICAEGRTIPLDLISKENIPQGYRIVFLIYSKYFYGKVNDSIQDIEIKQHDFKSIKTILITKINDILKERIPSIQEKNNQIKKNLMEKYPHYDGYFDNETFGLINRNKSLEIAQKRFFEAQREILEATNLTEEQYEKSIEISSRVLMEYILYRNITIEKLKKINKDNIEADIHNLIVPQYLQSNRDNFINDIYVNNAWLLDDKFMTYSTILSEKRMEDLIKTIVKDDRIKSDGRPDISIIFSDNPEKPDNKVDVVIVELKRLETKLAEKEEVISQLKQRARRLLKYYPKKIQRIFFYGILDFSSEFIDSLEEADYFEIYSKDKAFYGEEKVKYENKFTYIGVNLLSFDAFWKDAESRNETFLRILKNSFMKNKT